MVLVAGCSRSAPWPALSSDIGSALLLQGLTVSVSCTGEQAPLCRVRSADGSTLDVEISGQGDAWHWQLPARSVSGVAMERYVAGRMAALYPTMVGKASVNCGAQLQLVPADQCAVCNVGGERGAIAILTPSSSSAGGWNVEILPGPDAASARLQPIDHDELRRKSLALDQSDDSGADDDASSATEPVTDDR
jgi:hypothetical protein